MSYSLFLSSFYLIVGVLILFFGVVILRDHPRSAVHRATALMLFSGALGTILGALGQLLEVREAAGERIAIGGTLRHFAYLWEFFFPSLLYFALVYPVQQTWVRRRQVLEFALYVPHLFHLTLVLLLGESARLTRPFDALLERGASGGLTDFLSTVMGLVDVVVALTNKVHQQLFSLVNLAYAGVALGLLLRSRAHLVVSRLRRQLGIVFTGLAVGVVGYVAAVLLPVVRPYRENTILMVFLISVAMMISSATIAYAIVRHKFLDMQNLARRSVLYGTTALIFALLYLVVVRQITRFSAQVFGPNAEVIEAGFIVLSIILFQPLLTTVEDVLEGMIRGGDPRDPQTVMASLGRQLASEVDLRGMRARLGESLESSLLVRRVRLVTVEHVEGERHLDRGESRVPLDGCFAELLRFLAATGQPVLRHEVERGLPELEEFERLRLRDWLEEFHLLVPLLHQEQVRGFLGIGPKLTGGRFHSEDLALLTLLAQQMNTSLENVRLLSENVQKRILEEDIALASEIQQRLLPAVFPPHPGYESFALSLASKTVGGDYFDIFSANGKRVHLAIADVAGKGMAAALLMSSLRAALRSNVEHLQSPAQVLTRINTLLYESTSPEKFATFFYGVLDTVSHELVYANAGHNYPVLVHSDRRTTELTDGGLVLGAFPDVVYSDGRLSFAPGDTLFLYTDGVTEATNAFDDDFGEERLYDLLRRSHTCAPRALVQGVLDEVRAFAAGSDPTDDVTMLVMRRQAPAEILAATAAGESGVHGS